MLENYKITCFSILSRLNRVDWAVRGFSKHGSGDGILCNYFQMAEKMKVNHHSRDPRVDP